MRAMPPALAAHLERGATTLCHCWKLLRRDVAAFGFTDHDRDLSFGGVTFAARTGLEAAEATAELGFAVGGGEVSGALVSAGLTGAFICSVQQRQGRSDLRCQASCKCRRDELSP